MAESEVTLARGPTYAKPRALPRSTYETDLDRAITSRGAWGGPRGSVMKFSGSSASLQALFDTGTAVGLPDGQLLERFIARRDEGAFEALVLRHGPMVWGVCRRALPGHHDAEDAFQATFLVLSRKAASVLPREMLVNWLYGVASRTALKAKGPSKNKFQVSINTCQFRSSLSRGPMV